MSAEVTSKVLQNFLVLRKIFKNLSARQLNICCRVCRQWNDEAVKEKASRYQLHWNLFDVEKNADASEIKFRLDSFLKESPIEPTVALIFCTVTLCAELESLEDNNSSNRKKRKKTGEVTHAVLPSLFPRNCKTHISVTDGIIGTDSAFATEEYDEYEMALSVLLFGDYWDFKIHPFSCNHSHCQAMLQCWSEKSNSIPECFTALQKEKVKMFNLFCPMNGVDQEIGYSLFGLFDWPLVAGGNVCSSFLRHPDQSWCSNCSNCVLSGFAFCGESVQVASVLIRSHVDTEEQVDAVIKDLSAHNLPLEHSFGLMYACVGRNIHIYQGVHNVESKVFRKYFPKTPLFGFFGNGEIGFPYPQPDPFYSTPTNHLESDSEDGRGSGDASVASNAMLKRQMAEQKRKETEFKMKHPPKLMHAYTTVMCLVSIKKDR